MFYIKNLKKMQSVHLHWLKNLFLLVRATPKSPHLSSIISHPLKEICSFNSRITREKKPTNPSFSREKKKIENFAKLVKFIHSRGEVFKNKKSRGRLWGTRSVCCVLTQRQASLGGSRSTSLCRELSIHLFSPSVAKCSRFCKPEGVYFLGAFELYSLSSSIPHSVFGKNFVRLVPMIFLSTSRQLLIFTRHLYSG